MIGVDTNILVRFLTADEPDQYAVTTAFFRDRSLADPAFIASVTLAETVWVLRKSYGLSESEISKAVSMLCDSDDFVVEGHDVLRGADGNLASPALIADYLVAFLGQRAGCSHTITFDKAAARFVPGMEVLS